jgi:two-component system, OmpR family, sensor kinase
VGRLFWKFFLAVWLAQVVTFIGASAAFLLMRSTETRNDSGADARIDRLIGQVVRTIDGATEAPQLAIERRWPRNEALRDVLIVDAKGNEMFGRTIPADRLAVVHAALADTREPTRFDRGPGGDGPGGPNGDGGPPPRLDASLASPFDPGGPGPEFDGPDARVVRAIDGTQYVVLAAKQRASSRRRDAPLPWAPIAVALAASIAFGAFLAWYFAAPIRVMRSAFDEAARGNLAQRISPLIGSRRDELADLGRHYDRMAAQLAALMDGQRRLLHDVSHELRSPLARLQAAVGLARQQPDNTGASFERIEREADRMNDLVGELLTLSRLEAGVHGAPAEALDITELTAAVVEDARFEATGEGRQVAFTTDGPAIVKGQAELLHRAVENIVRNALRHTPEQSTIEVRVTREANRVRIAVLDAGPGVPAARVGEIFEPFVRMPGARSDGHGLGLAIARRVIESAGGEISAHNRAEGGLAVEIVLPLASSDDASLS